MARAKSVLVHIDNVQERTHNGTDNLFQEQHGRQKVQARHDPKVSARCGTPCRRLVGRARCHVKACQAAVSAQLHTRQLGVKEPTACVQPRAHSPVQASKPKHAPGAQGATTLSAYAASNAARACAALRAEGETDVAASSTDAGAAVQTRKIGKNLPLSGASRRQISVNMPQAASSAKRAGARREKQAGAGAVSGNQACARGDATRSAR